MPSAARLVLAALLALAAVRASHASDQAPQGEAGSPFDARIGWLNKCLAIKNDALEPGTPVTIILFGWGHDPIVKGDATGVRVAGTIVGKTRSGDLCWALSHWKGGGNDREDLSFYEVSLEEGRSFESTDLGIGIIGVGPEDPIDLDGNGVADSLTSCTSLEEVNFAVWKDEPHAGEPLWKDYYYLGYEVANPDCPGMLPDLSGSPSAWPIEARLGWLHGCLGVYNTQLQPGTPISIMAFAPQDEGKNGRTIFTKRIAGTILGKTDSSENCPPLAKDVRDWNVRWDIAYYTVALESGEHIGPDTLGVGVVYPEPGKDPFDLDSNGEADGFSVCNSGKWELTFVAWIGEAYESRPLSIGFVELGQKPNNVRRCPRDL